MTPDLEQIAADAGKREIEQRQLAVGALLNIAQDAKVRPGMRIHAARSVLFGGVEPDADEPYYDGAPQPTSEDASEDVYDAIAERVLQRLEPLLAELKGR